jgi:hypothetical protein
VAAVLDKPLDGAVAAYVRLVETIGATGRVQARTLIQFAQQGFDVLLVLSQTMGKSREEVARLVKEGAIGLREIDAALAKFSQNDFLGERGRTWEGIGKRVSAAWEEVHEVFGRPIIDALSPLLDKWITSALPAVIDLAGQAGESIAHMVRAFALIAEEQDWQTAVKAAWELLLYQMGIMIFEVLLPKFVEFGTQLNKAILFGMMAANPTSLLLGGPNPVDVFMDTLLDKAKKRSAEISRVIAEALVRTEITAPNRGVGAAADLSSTTVRRASNLADVQDMSGVGKESDWEKLRTDLTEINDMWYQMSLIQSKVGDQTERNRRINELFRSTAKDLYNPAQLEEYVRQLEEQGVVNARLILQDAERVRKQKELDAAIKAGTASLEQSMASGVRKATEAWGNFDQMVEKSATDITNALANDISSGLTDILTGTKSVSEGFRDMALAIIKDIEAIIVKMLVQLAIQKLLGAFTSDGGAGGGGSFASGGPVWGGTGTADDVPILAMGGEYVMPKGVVRNEGIERMELLRRGQATIVRKYADGGQVWGGSHYGTSPAGMNPPWHFDPYGSSADYDFWRGSLNTRFRNDAGTPRYPPLGDVDIPPIGEDPTIMTPPVPRPTTPPRPPRPGPNYGLPRDPGQGLGGPSLFGGPRGEPTVQVNWVGQGSVPYWNQPPTQVGPGNVQIGANLAGSYNSSLGTWDVIDAAGNLTRTPVPAPSSFGSGLASAGLSVVGFDSSTGTTFYRDSSGNTYASGPSSPRETQPGGATSSGGPATGAVSPYSNFGGVVSGQRSTVGNAAFDSHAAGLMQMAFQSFGGNPNSVPHDRERNPVYEANPYVHGQVIDGVVVSVPGGFGQGPRDPRWVFPSQAESARLGLSYSDRAHVEANNAWLAAHNQWYYGPGGVLEQQRSGQAPTTPKWSSGPPIITPHAGPVLPGYSQGGLVQAFLAMGAKRMHSGGEVGGDEVPIVARRGEHVVTAEDWRAMSERGGVQNNSNQVIVEVHYHEATGQTETKTRSKGGDTADADALAKAIEPMVNRFMLKQKRAGGINAR